MNKLLILCCINIISLIYAAPLKNDAKIDEILQQLEFLKKCPAVLNNNIDKHKSIGGLSHCKNVSLGNAPDKIDLTNLNDFHCVGLLAADIQLCSGNKTNKLPKNYDDLKSNIDKIKNETPAKICNELKHLKLFNETENVASFKKWIQVLDKYLHNSQCIGLCSDIDNGNTNVLCSMIYYISNNISYVVAEKKIILPSTTQVAQDITTPPTNKGNAPTNKNNAPTNNDNALQNVATSPLKEVPLNSNTNVVENTKTTALANIKDNAPPLETKSEAVKPPKPVPSVKIDPPPVNNQPEVAVDKPQKEQQPVIEMTTIKQVASIQTQKESVVGDDVAPPAPPTPVKTEEPKQTPVKTEESKQLPPVVNPISGVDDTQKVATNVESSSVSSTISGARDELADDYFEEVDEINKENEDQLIPQINQGKEAIAILANDQDRHRIPTEDGDDMEESNFFSYFMFVSVMFIAGYVVYHNKQKIMALLLEGRRDRNSRRRPNTASYRKLNSNLEEAVTSKCSGSASHVIY